MVVSMMNVGKMCVRVRHRLMDVRMRVRFARIDIGRVRVPMMFVVKVAMRVLQSLVRVLVRVPLGEMQPHTARHQRRRYPKRAWHRFAQKRQRHQRTNERRQRKVGAGSRRADVPQRQHEKRETQSVAEKPDDQGANEYSNRRPRRAQCKSNR